LLLENINQMKQLMHGSQSLFMELFTKEIKIQHYFITLALNYFKLQKLQKTSPNGKI